MEQLQKLATQLQSLQQSVQQVQQGLRSEQQRSTSLEARVTAEEQKYIGLEQTLCNEQQKSEKKVAKLENKLMDEQRRSSTLEARLSAEENKSTMLQKGLATEQQKSSALETRLTAEEQKSAMLEKGLITEQQKYSALETRLTAEEQKSAMLEKGLITEQQKYSALETRLTAEEQKSAMLEKGLITEQQKYSALETRLTTEEQKSSALETKCESLESALAAEKEISQLLDAKCRSQEERLKTVEDTVERLWTISRDEINFSNKIIGTGGWGYVTEASFRGRKVAAKCLHEAIISPHNQKLFAKEMKIFARCRHKNLIEFIGAVPDHPAVIVTEMMDCTLRFALTNARVIPNHIHPICIDVAQGLDYLHGIQPHPLIHRDVSAPNVLLKVIGKGWIAKLSDLGSAQFANIAKTLAPGCVLYAAPEVQQRDTAVKQTEKIDVYSFGVLLIEILTKEMPIGILTQLINSLQLTRPRFIPLIRQCTNADPTMRPTMREVITLLDTINI